MVSTSISSKNQPFIQKNSHLGSFGGGGHQTSKSPICDWKKLLNNNYFIILVAYHRTFHRHHPTEGLPSQSVCHIRDEAPAREGYSQWRLLQE
jgi:hypothetical protein